MTDAKMRVICITSGGDWADASVDHVKVPADCNLNTAYDGYRKWLEDVYWPQCHDRPRKIKSLTFPEWLMQERGATGITSADMEYFHEGP